MENDYRKELEKDEKNPYQEQIEAQKGQIEELKAQIADQQKQMKNAYQPNGAYREQSGYAEVGSGYQPSSAYQRYQGNDVYAKRATQKAYGNYDKQAQIKRRTEGVDAVMSFGILGAMAFSGQTAAIGSAVASGAGAAGLTSIAALGSLPVAGPLLLGGGALMLGGAAAYMAADTAYKGVKGLVGLVSNKQPMFNRPNSQLAILPSSMNPIRTKNSAGKFKELKDNSNKVDGYLKDIKKDFAIKKDIGTKIKDVANLKGLTSRQKKEVAGLYGDNIIRNSAKDNGGVVNAYNVKKQVVIDAKEQGWNKSKTAQMVSGVNKRLEVQKDKQNITKNNKVLSMQKADFKTKGKAASNNVEKQTVNVGNSVKAAANNLNFKPQPPRQPQPQKAQPSASFSKDNERGS